MAHISGVGSPVSGGGSLPRRFSEAIDAHAQAAAVCRELGDRQR
ncbi:hypothetical protein ACFV1F_03505 [Streptomyces sp. NPDC059590]